MSKNSGRSGHLTIGAAALIALISTATVAGAQEPAGTLKKIKDTGTITIGHREASLPFSYLDANKQPVGYAIDLCLKIVDGRRERVPGSRPTESPDHSDES